MPFFEFCDVLRVVQIGDKVQVVAHKLMGLSRMVLPPFFATIGAVIGQNIRSGVRTEQYRVAGLAVHPREKHLRVG